ncbi:hypothetical protein DOK67_0002655 [Enterococcus sp. DIV0212c]|uniref:MucBP domain-containing protein n=1 Tax=Enterococcus sp. DIV0212c TaxID=2230867 RepID=UPI001A9B99FC|nr:MucBP domain-containing protein [Enterococcus sp. DIV0212c]MBO1353415.1 MucBP domain-containing protein [Enterococcus sp. DIV0212c]
MKKSIKSLSAMLLLSVVIPTNVWAEPIITANEQTEVLKDIVPTIDSTQKTDNSITSPSTLHESIDSWMPDQQLQKIVLGTLIYIGTLPQDAIVSDISKEHMKSLDYIDISLEKYFITTIQGLEYAVNLTSIAIYNEDYDAALNLNDLFDLSPLYELPLSSLEIDGYLPYDSDFKTIFIPFLTNAEAKGITLSISMDGESISNLNQTLIFTEKNYVNATYLITDFIQVPESLAAQIEYKMNTRHNTMSLIINGIPLTYQINYDDATRLINLKLLTPNITYDQLIGKSYFLINDFNKDPYGKEQTTFWFDNENFYVFEFKLFNEVLFSQSDVSAKDLIVRYIDESGNEINDSQFISGKVGDRYNATTTQYKLEIDGYTLDEEQLPNNGIGELSDQVQTVTYVYKNNPTKGQDVTVNYVDETGKAIHDSQLISGILGEKYDASSEQYKLIIDNYELDEDKLPRNLTGIISEQAQNVTYVYKQKLPSTSFEDHRDEESSIKVEENRVIPSLGESERHNFLIIGFIFLFITSFLYKRKTRKVNRG